MLDSNIGAMTRSDPGDVDRVMDSIQALPPAVPSRDWLYKHMGEQVGAHRTGCKPMTGYQHTTACLGGTSRIAAAYAVLVPPRIEKLKPATCSSTLVCPCAQGFSVGLREWLGSSLIPDGKGQLKWAFNISGAAAMYESYRQMSYWDLVASPPPGVTLNIVRAAKSDR